VFSCRIAEQSPGLQRCCFRGNPRGGGCWSSRFRIGEETNVVFTDPIRLVRMVNQIDRLRPGFSPHCSFLSVVSPPGGGGRRGGTRFFGAAAFGRE